MNLKGIREAAPRNVKQTNEQKITKMPRKYSDKGRKNIQGNKLLKC